MVFAIHVHHSIGSFKSSVLGLVTLDKKKLQMIKANVQYEESCNSCKCKSNVKQITEMNKVGVR